MVKFNRWQERGGVVTGTASHAGRNVVGRLAAAVKAIVATLTGAFLNHDVTETNSRKTGRSRRVTAFTCGRDGYVLDRFGQGTALVILHVTGRTLFRRPLENAVNVAGLATHGLVCPAKLKSGAHVVKRSAGLLRMRQIESAK